MIETDSLNELILLIIMEFWGFVALKHRLPIPLVITASHILHEISLIICCLNV